MCSTLYFSRQLKKTQVVESGEKEQWNGVLDKWLTSGTSSSTSSSIFVEWSTIRHLKVLVSVGHAVSRSHWHPLLAMDGFVAPLLAHLLSEGIHWTSQTNVLHYGPLSVCMGHLALLPFSSFMSTLPPKTDHVWKYMGTQLWGDFHDTITGYDSIKQWAYWTECIHHYNSFYSHTSKVGWLEKQKSFIIQQQLLGKKKNPKLKVKQLAL